MSTSSSDIVRDSSRLILNFVNGEWVSASPDGALQIRNPATGDPLARTPLSNAADVDQAVQAAKSAFPAWCATPVGERVQPLFRLKALIEAEQDGLADLLTREHGKTRRESLGEIRRGIDSVEHACSMPSLLMGQSLENVATGLDCEVVRRGAGVFTAVTPYNFPVMIPLWFWPFAVACGNTFVLKPSEQDPLAHQAIVELARQAGFPPGVLNVVHGGADAVTALLEHPDVCGVSFVGSTPIARRIYALAAASGKRVQAMGGAKNHIVIMPDANLDRAVNAAVSSVFGCTGQRCLAGSIVVGVSDAYSPLRTRFLEQASSIRVGNGLQDEVEMGPLISRRHYGRVAQMIEHGTGEGAEVILDGRQIEVRGHPKGHWFGPTVLGNILPGMRIGQEEIFGPVAGLVKADDIESAVRLMQGSPYGNAASIFTSSGRAAREFKRRADVGMIGVNVGTAAPMALFPFGGVKDSFFGDSKAQGCDAVEFYTEKRVVISRW